VIISLWFDCDALYQDTVLRFSKMLSITQKMASPPGAP
jgi:hypothetical protein